MAQHTRKHMDNKCFPWSDTQKPRQFKELPGWHVEMGGIEPPSVGT